MRIWDPIWLTVFFSHNVTYIYCAIISRVKCVACVKLLVLLILELSFGLERGWVFFVHLYFCMFQLSVYGVVAPRFKFCEVVACFLGVVVDWVGLLSLCSLPFLRG